MSIHIENAIIDKEIIENIIENKEYNKIIINYYSEFASEFEDDYKNTILNKVINIDNCNKFWLLDKYEIQKVKDVKRQNLCKDKFCSNCKKVKQSARMARYIPELEKYSDRLYHMVLTVPNCNGTDLKDTIKHMNKCFKYLIQYIRGDRTTKDIDFNCWKYEGAVKSLEVTFKGNSYHPHFHIGLVMDPNVLSKRCIQNRYSINNRGVVRKLSRLFTKEEILIQKVWYLLVNGQRVNKKNIDNIECVRSKLGEKIVEDLGYSCMIVKFPPEQYAELFKYVTKEKDEMGKVLTYDNFKSLYNGLYRVKQIQGYGCLYRIKDDVDLELFEQKYNEYLNILRQKESPAEVLENPQDLLLDTSYKLINRKSYFKYLRKL
ncbi:protein rep (plasmid) [Peptostreptococcaceae bacterium AGR-M142]